MQPIILYTKAYQLFVSAYSQFWYSELHLTKHYINTLPSLKDIHFINIKTLTLFRKTPRITARITNRKVLFLERGQLLLWVHTSILVWIPKLLWAEILRFPSSNSDRSKVFRCAFSHEKKAHASSFLWLHKTIRLHTASLSHQLFSHSAQLEYPFLKAGQSSFQLSKPTSALLCVPLTPFWKFHHSRYNARDQGEGREERWDYHHPK